ncbi:hypothetical protein E8E11_007302 [Didymella keratinophila]|nr:hypothetical protein E8E11_007302 [Didymella keratinophila]
MLSFTQTPPSGLPTSPRANRPMLLPLETTFQTQDSTPSSSSDTLASHSEQTTPNTRVRSRDSLIFANAIIPLSPVSSTSDRSTSDTLLDGLTPRKRNGFVRFFCCFGREERARRRVLRETQFEKVGEKCHWTEY